MSSQLFAKQVITLDQKKSIDKQIGRKEMDYLILEILIPSLKGKFSKKYKSFLRVMEDNDDIDLQSAAKMLGEFISVYNGKCEQNRLMCTNCTSLHFFTYVYQLLCGLLISI